MERAFSFGVLPSKYSGRGGAEMQGSRWQKMKKSARIQIMKPPQKILFISIAIALFLGLLYYIGTTVSGWQGLRTLVLIWVIGLGIIALGIFVAEKFGKKYAPLLIIGMLSGFTILADLGSIKLSAIQLGGMEFIAPAGSLLFAVLYFGSDYLNELYGRKVARFNVYAGWLSKIAVALGMLFVIYVMGNPSVPDIAATNEQFNTLLSLGPRLNIASIVAILIAGLINVELFSKLRELTQEKYLWLRVFVASTTAIIVDNFVFTFGAFLFVIPVSTIWNITWTTSAVHITIAICSPAFLYLLRYLKRAEIIGSHEQLIIPTENEK